MPLVRSFVVCACLSFSLVAAAAAPPPSPEREAEAAFDKQDWARAAAGYEALTKGGATLPKHWMRLALARHRLGQRKEAVAAYERVIALKAPQSTVAHYNLACLLAAAPADRDRAFAELAAAVQGGTSPHQLKSDPDLLPLVPDPRYAALVDKAERLAFPCKHAPEHAQFDFWVGEWDVFQGQNRAGTSRIEKSAEGCLVVEHWTGTTGHSGKSLNFYLPREKRWRQTWVGSDGDIIEFVGVLDGGEMRFSAASWTAAGEPFFRRLTFSPRREGSVTKVRQLGEISKDGGRTFAVEYDLLYVPRAASAKAE